MRWVFYTRQAQSAVTEYCFQPYITSKLGLEEALQAVEALKDYEGLKETLERRKSSKSWLR